MLLQLHVVGEWRPSTFSSLKWMSNIIFPPFLFYFDRHVQLPKDLAKLVPKSHLMTEAEWRGLGVQQSQGWIHYMIHQPGIDKSISFVLYVMKVIVLLFCRASHSVVSTPHHHTPNGRKGIIKKGLATRPPESHQVRLNVLLLIIIPFDVSCPIHLFILPLLSSVQHFPLIPFTLKDVFFFHFF